MLGTCMFCDQKRIVEDAEVAEYAIHHGISEEMAADSIAAHQCNCDGARLARQKEDTIKMATDYINNEFDQNPKVRDAAAAAIEAIVNMGCDNVTIKKGKKKYTIQLDNLGCLKLKINFTDKEEVKF